MSREQAKRYIQGPIATLPTPFDDQYQIDYGRMADLTQWWVDQGLVAGRAPLQVAAAMGEGPDLDDTEWPRLLETVVKAAGDQAAVICALQTKDTLRTIADAKRAQDLGAIGLQIDLPIFHHPTQDDYVRYFTDISDAIDIGIMIYNTFWFGAPPLTVETMRRLRDAEHVVAVKWSAPADGSVCYDDMRAFAADFNVIDNASQPVRAHRNGARGFIDSTTPVHPAYPLGVWDLLEAGRYDEAQAEFDRVHGPLGEFSARAHAKSGGYRVPKGLMAAVNQPVGPPRPPTLPLDEAEMAEVRAIVQNAGWIQAG